MEKRKHIAFWVDSRFSNSHIDWVVQLANALSDRGLDSTIITSAQERMNKPLADNVKVVALPGFKTEYGEHKDHTIYGKKSLDDAHWQEERSQIVGNALQDIAPDAIVTESWPLGKNQPYKKELETILAYQKETKTPLYGLSMDLPLYTRFPVNEPAGGDMNAASAIIEQQFQKVFFISDRKMARAEEVVPELYPVRKKFSYPGYFIDSQRIDALRKSRDTTAEPKHVSVAFGAGFKPTDAAFLTRLMHAKEQSLLKDYHWDVYVSKDCPKETFDALCKEAPKGVTVQFNSKKFQDSLPNTAVLISRCGYNTSVEALSLGTKCLFVPRASSREQKTRAALLEKQGLASVAQQDAPQDALIDSLNAVARKPRIAQQDFKNDGYIACAKMLEKDLGVGSARFLRPQATVARG